MSRHRTHIAVALFFVFLSLFPLSKNNEYMHLLIMMGFYVIGTACFRAMVLVGRFSLGQSFFVAIGGYASGILSVKLGVSPWLGMFVGGAGGAIFALAIGMVVLKVPGMYFAILTLALVMITLQTISVFGSITGGVGGLVGIPPYTIGSYSFGVDRIPYYYLIIAVTIIFFSILYRMEKSPLGLIIRATGQNDELVEHLGANVARYRILVFTLTGFMTAVAGAIFAHYLHYISPGDVGLPLAMYFQIYAIVGGMASILGPVVGVVFVELLNHVTGIALYASPILYGAVFVIIFIVLPKGLISLPQAIRKRKFFTTNL